MATVAVTELAKGKLMGGGVRVGIYDLSLTGNYTTGGETVSAQAFKMGSIFTILVNTPAGFHGAFNKSTGKVVFYESGTADAALDEVDAAALPAALTNTVQLVVLGR